MERFPWEKSADAPRAAMELSPRRFAIVSAAVYAVLVTALYGWVFFVGDGKALGGPDSVSQAVPWLRFMAQQLSHGHLPLWNPYYYSGTPFLGNVQSAMFYPPNWLALLLPVAIWNNLLFLHCFFFAGWMTSLWARARGLSVISSLFAGIVFGFSSPLTGHMSMGHLQGLEVAAWIPAVFLVVEMQLREPRVGWLLAGVVAVTMTILPGFAQFAYYTSVLAALYALLVLGGEIMRHFREKKHQPATEPFWSRRVLLPGCYMILMYIGGAAISAIQLLPVLSTSEQCVRSAGLSYAVATLSPEPVESLVTSIAPTFWGGFSQRDDPRIPYLGRGYETEVNAYMGVAVLALACFGAIAGQHRSRRFLSVLAGLCILITLGNATPLYDVLYRWLPLFGSFRSASRFLLPATLTISVLAGVGLDGLLRQPKIPWWFIVTLVCTAGVIIIGGLWLSTQVNSPGGGAWGRFLTYTASLHQHPDWQDESVFKEPDFILASGQHAVSTLALPVVLLLFVAGAVALVRVSPRFSYLIAAIGLIEILSFAFLNCNLTQWDPAYPLEFTAAVQTLGPDDRVICNNLNLSNLGVVKGYHDAYGYDPMIFTRYAEFLAGIQQDVSPVMKSLLAQGVNLQPPIDVQPQTIPGTRNTRFVFASNFKLLRCREVLAMLPTTDGLSPVVLPIAPYMDRAQFVSEYEIQSDRDTRLRRLNEPSFDARRTVLLETTPSPAPVPTTTPGTVSIVDRDTDTVEITADLSVPQILLLTDVYAADWHIRPLESNAAQSHYELLPADHTLQAIALAAGHHRFVMEYCPRSFTIGRACSIVALLMWLTAAGWVVTRRQPELAQ